MNKRWNEGKYGGILAQKILHTAIGYIFLSYLHLQQWSVP